MTYQILLPTAISFLDFEHGDKCNPHLCCWRHFEIGFHLEAVADFFKKRAGKATGEGLRKFLRTAPKTAPEPEDTLG